MKKRFLLLPLALLLPMVAAIGIARLALPGMLPLVGKNTMPIINPAARERVVPGTLEEAKRLAVERLMHLQRLTQAQWDVERKTIAYKDPPVTIDDAITRTQLRISDLNQMSEETWKAERERLLARAKK